MSEPVVDLMAALEDRLKRAKAHRCICWKGESTEGVLEDCPVHGVAGREGDR